MHPILARLALLSLLIGITPLSIAEQSKIPDYQTAKKIFWSKLYRNGGTTLYCAKNFGKRRGRGLNVEHVFPMSWVTKALDCGTRKECRRHSDQFNRIEADLHNLYPVRADLNDERGSFPFGEISGERRKYGACDFEVDFKRRQVEPRPKVRGDIARALFYMAETYGFKIFSRQARMLKRWHSDDPPDAADRQRNDKIEQLQGNRNPYIDQPERVIPF